LHFSSYFVVVVVASKQESEQQKNAAEKRYSEEMRLTEKYEQDLQKLNELLVQSNKEQEEKIILLEKCTPPQTPPKHNCTHMSSAFSIEPFSLLLFPDRRFQKYLESVVATSTEYKEVRLITDRWKTLESTSDQLREVIDGKEKEMERQKALIQKFQEVNKNPTHTVKKKKKDQSKPFLHFSPEQLTLIFVHALTPSLERKKQTKSLATTMKLLACERFWRTCKNESFKRNTKQTRNSPV
jgi:hypothetical protein